MSIKGLLQFRNNCRKPIVWELFIYDKSRRYPQFHYGSLHFWTSNGQLIYLANIHLFGIYKQVYVFCGFVWRDENVPIFLCTWHILKNWKKRQLRKSRTFHVSLRNDVFNECRMWMYAQLGHNEDEQIFFIGSSPLQKTHRTVVVKYFKILHLIFLRTIFQL